MSLEQQERKPQKKTKKKHMTLKSTSFWQAESVGMDGARVTTHYMSSLHNPQDIQYNVRHSVRG